MKKSDLFWSMYSLNVEKLYREYEVRQELMENIS
jgi:hypothetical protein